MASYPDWNELLVSWFFRPEFAGRTVWLSADAATLCSAANAWLGFVRFETEAAARADFLDAVRAEVARYGWRWRAPERATTPPYVALLAAQVLAYYETSTKEYWPKLAELLGVPTDPPEDLPRGLTGDLVQDLWRAGLEQWLNVCLRGGRGRLDLPADHPHSYRHVQLPRSQALLRDVDLERLPVFFAAAGLSPSTGPDAVGRAVRAWATSPDVFSGPARRVLAAGDHRFDFACRQIAECLRRWDGRAATPLPKPSPPPRAVELTARIGDSLRLGAAGPRGRHRPLDEEERHRLFAGSVVNVLELPDFPGPFRPFRSSLLLFVRDAVDGVWRTRATARPGDRAILLTRRSESPAWVHGVRAVAVPGRARYWCGEGRTDTAPWRSLAGLPTDWSVIELRLRQDLTGVAGAWADLIDVRGVRLTPEGGLRLGRRAWLTGAGPAVRVSDPSAAVRVDDRPAPVVDGLVRSPRLDEPGTHLVTSGDASLRIVVRDAAMGAAAFPGAWQADAGRWPVFRADAPGPEAAFVSGPAVVGPWPAYREPASATAASAAVNMLLRRSGRLLGPPAGRLDGHPLTAALGRTDPQTASRGRGNRTR